MQVFRFVSKQCSTHEEMQLFVNYKLLLYSIWTNTLNMKEGISYAISD